MRIFSQHPVMIEPDSTGIYSAFHRGEWLNFHCVMIYSGGFGGKLMGNYWKLTNSVELREMGVGPYIRVEEPSFSPQTQSGRRSTTLALTEPIDGTGVQGETL